MKFFTRFFCCCFFFAGLHASALAQGRAASPATISVNGFSVTLKPIAEFDATGPAQRSAGIETQLLVQVAAADMDAAKSDLTARGFIIQEYLGDGVFVVRAPSASASLRTIDGAVAAAPFTAAYKMAPELLRSGTSVFTALVQFYPDAPATQYTSLIAAAGGLVKNEKLAIVGAVEAQLSPAAARTLAASPLVRHIGLASKDEVLNVDTRAVTGAFTLQRSQTQGGAGLLGSGVVVGVGDNRDATQHIDLRERAINFVPSPGDGHGTHVSGTVGGTGILDPFARGVAPRATILNHFFNQVWAQTVPMRDGYGMTLTNNSYSSGPHRCDYNGTYDLTASMIDGIAVMAPDVLHVFAAGNSGLDSCPPYPKHFNSLPGGYQVAKNVVVVGSIYKPDANNTLSSSRGPTKDGRLKPDISALGDAIYSTFPNNEYGFSWGTSMAAPAVTGGLALLTERYRGKNGGATPSAALLRALLLNGATDRGAAGPDFTYGFGSMNLLYSVAMIDSARHFSGTMANGGSQTFSIQVPSGVSQMKVMLCYDDRAALPGATKALINDLDLEVSSSAGTHLPLIANPAPGSVTVPAMEGVDRLNNVEQVTINAPATGAYTVTVKGYSVPMGPQAYHLSYTFAQPGIRILQPVTGTAFIANYNHKIYWDAVDTTGTFTLEYTTDNGSTWTAIASGIPGSQRGKDWTVPTGVSSGACRVRITRSTLSETATSEAFAVNAIPGIGLSPVQCPGYIAFQWGTVANATGYEVLRKIGYDMEPVDTVTTTSFVFAGLSPDSTYYVAARPLFGNVPGYRTYGLARKPADGNCAGSISDGDFAVRRLATPRTGRVGTSTAFSASQAVQLVVRNLDDAPSGAYTVSYRVGGSGAWQTQTVTTSITALDSAVVSLPALNLAAPGSYLLQLAITGAAADPVRANDSLTVLLRQLSNPPVSLASAVVEDFESVLRFTILHDTLGFLPNERWDFDADSLGRIRSFVDPEVTVRGTRSLSMDAALENSGTQNYLQGTYNLANYSAATEEVRMEMRYRLHGVPKFMAGNEVQVRGNDGAGWRTIARYDTAAQSGEILSTGSVSITDAMLAGGQSFSSSSAIRIGQHDTSVIGGRSYGNGLTVDDVKLYTVQNDVQLVSIISPAPVDCGLDSNTALQVRVYNGVQSAQSNIQLFYRLDSGAVQSASLPQIPGKDTVLFTFPQTINAAAPGAHRLSVWLSAAGDTYRANDSILNYTFRNQPLIASFPYLENFEGGDGHFYSDGRNSSWGHGTPAGILIKNAASGTKAWKTGLSGQYNDREQSYLYTPCFDYTGLANPMLSFSAAVDIENCGDNYLCDIALVEWSSDLGKTWQFLGDSGQGYNWYNSNAFKGWTQEGFTRWHVASIPLPQATPMPVRLRFSMRSDGGETREGLAIDDVHVYSRFGQVHDDGSTGPIVRTIGAGLPPAFTTPIGVTAVVSGLGTTLGETEVQSYEHSTFIDSSTARYFLPRSFTVKPAQQPADSGRVWLFVADRDVERLLAETSCPTCTRPADVYRLGMSKYDSPVESEENGSLSDNRAGLYNFYPYSRIAWVPYAQGYYAEAFVKGFSEFWFFDDGPSVSYPPADAAVTLSARRTTATQVRVNWTSAVDSMVVQYELQRVVTGDTAFATILTKAGLGAGSAQTSYNDAPPATVGDTVSYRLKWRTLDGSQFFTSVRRVPWTEANIIAAVFPNPVTDGRIRIRWSADPASSLVVWLKDAVGRTVMRTTLAPDAFDNETSVPVPVAAGVYYLQVELGGKRWAEKVVVR